MNEPYRTEPNVIPEAPEHLSDEARAWWSSVCADYVLEHHHIKLLQATCEAWDTAQEARRKVEADGMTFQDRFGQPKSHPAVAVERKARDQFRLLTRELGLDVAPEPPRGPKAPANAHRLK